MTDLLIERDDGHWAITLNRPEKLNALSSALVEALIVAVDAAAAAAIPVISFRGAGRCFSAGFDMTDVDSQSDGDLLLRFVRIETLLRRIASVPSLTVALAHGRNFGAGVDLLGACKVRVCAEGTTFRMPGLQFGLVLGTARFARLVGPGEACRILETSATFDSGRATTNGFVDTVLPRDAWEAFCAEQRQRATSLSATARKQLYRVLDDERADADLAALVRSAAEPGLKQRINQYRSQGAKE